MGKSRYTAEGEDHGLDGPALRELRRQRDIWRREAGTKGPVPKQRVSDFTTLSGISIPDLATPLDVSGDYLAEVGFPGQYPFTRGVYPSMHRGRLWTMRMFAGFGTASQSNARFRYLLEHGQTGLSTAFDFPTLMGYDSDSPRALGEVGMCGVAIDTLKDMETLFEGIPLDEVTTSMTINGPAIVLLAFYVALADQRGIPRESLGGTIQNDCLKEFIAQHAWVVPPRPAMRLVTDMIEFCSAELPRWHPVSISGYHIREAGATAGQELAFTLADGIAYVQACVERGLVVDSFAPRLSFFFDVHSDFLEEVAKFRAARRMWAKIMKHRFGATDPRSMRQRTHAQTAGVSLTAQQPFNNIARVAMQALAAVMGGVQSLHTNAYDETYALPTQESVTLALRIQQIIAHETGVTNTIDPLGGSYAIEWLTNHLEDQANEYIAKIDRMGGMLEAVEQGYPQREIALSAYHRQRQVEANEKVIVGVNKYRHQAKDKIPTLKIDEEAQRAQVEALAQLKQSRDRHAVDAALGAVRAAAEQGNNLMPPMIAAAKVYCTEQELCDVLRQVFGTYSDRPEI